MKKNLGLIIGKKDSIEGTIYYTETCEYLIIEEKGKFIVEGLLDGMKKTINFIPEGEGSFVVGSFNNEKEAIEAIAEFEKTQWGK